MKTAIKYFSFPYKTHVLIFSVFMLILPVLILSNLEISAVLKLEASLLRLLFLIPTLIATIGLVYCTIGYHFQILRGDELKLRIHLEALNIAFTTTLVFFFIFIFLLLNFAPDLLISIIFISSIILIISYLIALQIVKVKYQ